MSKDKPVVLGEETKVPFTWLVVSVVFACSGAWGTATLLYTFNSKLDNTQKDVRVLKLNVHKLMAKDHVQPVEDPEDEQSKSSYGPFSDAEARSSK